MVDTQNVNRNTNDVEARSVTAALSALGVKEEEDKHPERYALVDGRSIQNLSMESGLYLCVPLSVCSALLP